jgi:O-antigen ligase
LMFNWYNNNQTLERFASIVPNFRSESRQSIVKRSGRIKSESRQSGNKDSREIRIFIWEKSVQLIRERPWTGYGPDTFDLAFMRAYRGEARTYVGRLTIDNAHNEYLQLAVTTGVPSALLYVTFLALILNHAFRNAKKSILVIPLLCSISGYMIQACFNLSVVSVAPVYWSLLGILCKFAYDPISVPHGCKSWRASDSNPTR